MNSAEQDNTSINMEEEISRKEKIIHDYKNKIEYQTNEMKLKDSKISRFESDLSLKDSQIKNIESKLVNRDIMINSLENRLKSANSNFDSLTHKINEAADEFNILNDEINKKEIEYRNNENKLKYEIKIKDNKINDLKENLTKKENDLTKKENEFTTIANELNNQINNKQKELDGEKKKLNSLECTYRKNLSKLENKEYCISCYKEEISNNQIEIKYLKNNNITKKILTPIAYLYLIFKSKRQEISLNIKLYKVLKNSKCFDIGFYLNKNKDLINSNWCKYFSPELHYVCNGFNENRKFNKKYFNRNSKKELLEYLLNCDE